jgi:CRP/FNR family cyclic AMP-dependent transcriptional regulator
VRRPFAAKAHNDSVESSGFQFFTERRVLRGHHLRRGTRFEEDLVDQLFNSSGKGLARILVLRAHFGKESRSEAIHPEFNQEQPAQMVGTTRSRVSHFTNKFRILGFIDYAGSGALTVNNCPLSIVLRD